MIFKPKDYQPGVTSLFVVIFTALLFSIIVVGFATMMNREQQRSTDDELSQSAYDSAMAGVEDAKRVIMKARTDSQAQQAIDGRTCDTVALAGVAGQPGEETIIQTSSATGTGAEMNQAYTCVKIDMTSPDYRLDLEAAMRSKMVPLVGAREFDAVRISWHANQGNGLAGACSRALSALGEPLCAPDAWGNPLNTPALLRAQFITPGNQFSPSSFDEPEAGNTVFIYPKNAPETVDLANLPRQVDRLDSADTATHRPVRAGCVALGSAGDYHCSATIDLGKNIAAGELALLRLAAFYSAPTSVSITLLSGSSVVSFDGVQPTVDSTGRANDLFRRVEARLSLAADVSYPEAALDVGGALCKHFFVTSNSQGKVASLPDCTP